MLPGAPIDILYERSQRSRRHSPEGRPSTGNQANLLHVSPDVLIPRAMGDGEFPASGIARRVEQIMRGTFTGRLNFGN
jgi:hypothetical protein